MITTYKLNTNELSEKLVDMIRTSFPNKEIEIIVLEQEADEYLRSSPANEAHINESIRQIENGEDLITVDPTKL